MIHQVAGNPGAVLDCTERLARLGSEYEFVDFDAFVDVFRGWALIVQEHSGDELPRMHRGAEILRRAGVDVHRPYALGLLADAHRRVGDLAKASDLLRDAFASARNNGPNLYDAELHRLDGELKLESGVANAFDEAEASFAHAMAIAREQQGKWWEMRSALSLASLQRRRGLEHEALALVPETYAWFTEGFDTPTCVPRERSGTATRDLRTRTHTEHEHERENREPRKRERRPVPHHPRRPPRRESRLHACKLERLVPARSANTTHTSATGFQNLRTRNPGRVAEPANHAHPAAPRPGLAPTPE